MVIKESTLNPSNCFTLDGLEYGKGVYTPFYTNKTVDSQGDVLKDEIRVGIRSQSEFNKVLVSPLPITSWNNGVDDFTDVDELVSYLVDLLFNPAGGSSALQTGRYLIGWQDFADSNTSEASPLVQTNVNGGEVQLTNNNNDTATDGTTNQNSETTVIGLNDLWDTSTNTFIFDGTGIQKNDLFDIRVHLNISSNIVPQDFELRIDFYDEPAGAGNYQFSLTEHVSTDTLSAGVFRERIVNMDGYVGESILNGSAKIFLVGTKSFEVEVVGWKINIFKIASGSIIDTGNVDQPDNIINTINSTTVDEPSGSDVVPNIVTLTQAEYDASTPVATTFYIING
jgi:hypothetical protein